MRRDDQGKAGLGERRARGLRSAFVLAVLLPGLADAAAPPEVELQGAEAPAPPEAPAEAEVQSPDPPPEVEPQTAGEWYARGYELGNEGDYSGAAEAFMRSYELKPTSEALFNAAVAHENAGTPIMAIDAYRRFLTEPERSAKLSAAAERAIEALQREIGVLKGLRYTESRPPSRLFVNGEAVEIDAFPLMVMPGEVELVVLDEAGTRHRELYELNAGESLILDLRAMLPVITVEANPGLEGPDRGPSSEEQGARRAQFEKAQRTAKRRTRNLRWASFATLGLAGASGVAALSFGLLANDARKKFEADTCLEFPGGDCPDDFVPGDPGFHNRSYERYALASAILSGVSAGFAVGALVTGVLSLRYRRESRTSARVHIRPSLGGVHVEF